MVLQSCPCGDISVCVLLLNRCALQKTPCLGICRSRCVMHTFVLLILQSCSTHMLRTAMARFVLSTQKRFAKLQQKMTRLSSYLFLDVHEMGTCFFLSFVFSKNPAPNGSECTVCSRIYNSSATTQKLKVFCIQTSQFQSQK